MQLSTVTLLSSVHSEVSGLLLSYIGNGQEELLDGQTDIGQGQPGSVVFNLGRVSGSIH